MAAALANGDTSLLVVRAQNTEAPNTAIER